MPISIHGSEPNQRLNQRPSYRRFGMGVCILYGMGLMALVVGLVRNPKLADWVSEAAQLEFVGPAQLEFVGPDVPSGAEPTRLAQPADRFRTVTAN